MSVEFRTLTILKVYLGEDTYYDDRPLYKAIIEEAHTLHIAGATAYKCVEGYASEVRGHERKLLVNFSDSSNLPIVLEFVDTREKFEPLLKFLEKNVQRGLVTISDATCLMTEYMKKASQSLQQAAIDKK
ncbi:MAG: DUF190 domain-containing protein [Acidaminococcaceae bacterium]